MRKNKLLLLLALLMTAATGAWAAAENENIIFNNLGLANAYDLTSATLTVGNINLDFAKGTGSSIPAFYTSGGGTARLYKGNTMSVDASGATITKIVFTYASEVTPEFSTGSYNSSTKTWEGEATTLTVTNAYTTNTQIRITSMDVYYSAASGYTVSLNDGTENPTTWTASTDGTNFGALPIGGLKGDGSETVTLQYTGRLKVKGVTATSEAAAPSVPDGAISGVFSVSDGKQVYFSKGNLRYASSKWSFFDNQYDYYTSYSADAWDKFGWSTSATTYGMSTSSSNGDYSGDFVDWGATMGAGWRTLTSDEWAYLLKTRSASTVNGTENGRYAKAKVNDVGGVILFPDTYTHPDGVAAPTGVNATDEYGWEGNSYTAADWTKMESAGCVFLPAAGCRYGSEMIGLGSYGYYGSATPDGADYAYRVKFNSGSLEPANSINRCLGCSVRLVQEVAPNP